jgi:hypothetical protein
METKVRSNVPILLAHGALGPFDEIIFLGIAAVFLIAMSLSWFKSRYSQPPQEPPPTQRPTDDTASADRFPLD